jgi:hypothetical protein
MTSRTELVAWANDLLQINYTKVEQFGAGGALCQIVDSIYGTRSRPRAAARLICERLSLTAACARRRCPNGACEDERAPRIRVHWELQDPSDVFQGEED